MPAAAAHPRARRSRPGTTALHTSVPHLHTEEPQDCTRQYHRIAHASTIAVAHASTTAVAHASTTQHTANMMLSAMLLGHVTQAAGSRGQGGACTVYM
eukprot:1040900-Rhodomonas_salina.1